MNKKMLLSVLIIGVVAVSAGAGTWAFFSDTETSVSNSFTAGTLDLVLTGGDQAGDSVTDTFDTPDYWAPGEDYTGEILTVSNAGTIDAATVKLTVAIGNSGGLLNEPECEAENGVWDVTTCTSDPDDPIVIDDVISNHIIITQLDYPATGTSIIGAIQTAISDPTPGSLTLAELGTLTNYNLGALAGGADAELEMTVQLDSGVTNEHQGDSSSITMTFLADQDQT